MYILNNGKLTRNKNIISIEDRGYLLGDAVFETILYKDKNLILFNLHLDRLISSLKLVKIKAILYKRKLQQDILGLIEKNKLSNKTAVIRITISRVSNERGIDIHDKQGVCIIVKSSELKNDLRLKPITLDISNIKRNEKSFVSKIKSTNYLENIIAKNDAIQAGYNDAIFTNNSGKAASFVKFSKDYLEGFFTSILARVLLIQAENSALSPGRQQNALSEWIRHMDIQKVSGSHHLHLEGEAEDVARLIQKFLV